ncbi:MAG: deoxyuridine 5-triphosphate nucleotidohydrolase Dut [Thermoleophilia bacterium]|nr:deoxyuridine 5-triphosphate nucleotidohydrolase Dut [Thermoleophilia bacterium]
MTTTPATLRVQRLHPDAVIPSRSHPGDAGIDLVAIEAATLRPGGGRAVIGTGIAVEIPEGWAGLVCPRSGLAAKHGIGVVNGPGVVDAGYRGEVRVVLANSDPETPFDVAPGDRIAQLLLVPVSLAKVELVDELSDASRGSDGFGSTGGFAATSAAHGDGASSNGMAD